VSTPSERKRLKSALEASIRADPDDLAAHAAYADLLMESSDPEERDRGEFTRVQLALEGVPEGTDDYWQLRRREWELLRPHQARWLGRLAPDLLGPPWRLAMGREIPEFSFRRGRLYSLFIPRMNPRLARALAACPQARSLRSLAIGELTDSSRFYYTDDPRATAAGLEPLLEAPFLPRLRYFRLGSEPMGSDGPGSCVALASVGDLLRRLTGLEELRLIARGFDPAEVFALNGPTRLRVLVLIGAYGVYRLEVLAGNPAFQHLTTLILVPHGNDGPTWRRSGAGRAGFRREEGYLPLSAVRPLLWSPQLPNLTCLCLVRSSLGDQGCVEIARSGILRRLKELTLRYGCITDAGAEALAGCPDLRHLESLYLCDNALTPAGIERLKGTGAWVCAYPQLTPRDVQRGRYLSAGDYW
jgi:uncharacterized protein (TIGR02996 family)